MAVAGLMMFSAAGWLPAQYYSKFVYTTNLYPVADATIRSDDPDGNYGGVNYVMAGSSNGTIFRGLLRFDLSGIPTNDLVSNVTMSVVTVNQGAGYYYQLDRLLTNWVESQVTWNSRATGQPWSAPGASNAVDFYPYLSSYAFLSGPGVTNIFTNYPPYTPAGLIPDAQLWVGNPSQNFGWILRDLDEANGSSAQIGSRENPGSQPVLTVTYTPPFAPPVLKVAQPTNSEFYGEFCFTFNMEAGYGYQIYESGNPAGTNWHVILVMDPAPASQIAEFCFPFASTNTFYRIGYL
jgi:hypothetical protein